MHLLTLLLTLTIALTATSASSSSSLHRRLLRTLDSTPTSSSSGPISSTDLPSRTLEVTPITPDTSGLATFQYGNNSTSSDDASLEKNPSVHSFTDTLWTLPYFDSASSSSDTQHPRWLSFDLKFSQSSLQNGDVLQVYKGDRVDGDALVQEWNGGEGDAGETTHHIDVYASQATIRLHRAASSSSSASGGATNTQPTFFVADWSMSRDCPNGYDDDDEGCSESGDSYKLFFLFVIPGAILIVLVLVWLGPREWRDRMCPMWCSVCRSDETKTRQQREARREKKLAAYKKEEEERLKRKKEAHRRHPCCHPKDHEDGKIGNDNDGMMQKGKKLDDDNDDAALMKNGNVGNEKNDPNQPSTNNEDGGVEMVAPMSSGDSKHRQPLERGHHIHSDHYRPANHEGAKEWQAMRAGKSQNGKGGKHTKSRKGDDEGGNDGEDEKLYANKDKDTNSTNKPSSGDPSKPSTMSDRHDRNGNGTTVDDTLKDEIGGFFRIHGTSGTNNVIDNENVIAGGDKHNNGGTKTPGSQASIGLTEAAFTFSDDSAEHLWVRRLRREVQRTIFIWCLELIGTSVNLYLAISFVIKSANDTNNVYSDKLAMAYLAFTILAFFGACINGWSRIIVIGELKKEMAAARKAPLMHNAHNEQRVAPKVELAFLERRIHHLKVVGLTLLLESLPFSCLGFSKLYRYNIVQNNLLVLISCAISAFWVGSKITRLIAIPEEREKARRLEEDAEDQEQWSEYHEKKKKLDEEDAQECCSCCDAQCDHSHMHDEEDEYADDEESRQLDKNGDPISRSQSHSYSKSGRSPHSQQNRNSPRAMYPYKSSSMNNSTNGEEEGGWQARLNEKHGPSYQQQQHQGNVKEQEQYPEAMENERMIRQENDTERNAQPSIDATTAAPTSSSSSDTTPHPPPRQLAEYVSQHRPRTYSRSGLHQ